MDKYVLTTGSAAVVVELTETPEFTAVKFHTNQSPIHFDTIGEAMKAAAKINKVLGNPICKVIQTSVSSNL